MFVDSSRVAASSLRVLPREQISRVMGRIARLRLPGTITRRAVEAFCRSYAVDMSEAEIPARGFESFDQFFTRQLKPGCRPIDPDIVSIVSPADGLLQAAGCLEPGAVFRVKGRLYRADELLGDAGEARRFEGGLFAVIYLNPGDYHRVHSPVTGSIEAVRHIGGTLFPVNSIGLEHIPNLLARNERVVFYQNGAQGLAATVMVGAMGVGRISVSFDDELVTNNGQAAGARVYSEHKPFLERGEELGVFHLGSTVVLFVPGDIPRILVKSSGERVRVGEAIARNR
jgi:phosphatidylserine decarboxylase